MEEGTKVSDADWEKRVLCSDDGCIGVIGPDGRCKECGKPYQGRQSDDQSAAPAEESAQHPVLIDEPQDADPGQQNTTDLQAENDDWERRVLCRDEMCIGVIGPDGRCKECGRPFED